MTTSGSDNYGTSCTTATTTTLDFSLTSLLLCWSHQHLKVVGKAFYRPNALQSTTQPWHGSVGIHVQYKNNLILVIMANKQAHQNREISVSAMHFIVAEVIAIQGYSRSSIWLLVKEMTQCLALMFQTQWQKELKITVFNHPTVIWCALSRECLRISTVSTQALYSQKRKSPSATVRVYLHSNRCGGFQKLQHTGDSHTCAKPQFNIKWPFWIVQGHLFQDTVASSQKTASFLDPSH